MSVPSTPELLGRLLWICSFLLLRSIVEEARNGYLGIGPVLGAEEAE